MTRKTEMREPRVVARPHEVTTCDDCGKEDAHEVLGDPVTGGLLAGYTVNTFSALSTCNHMVGLPNGWTRVFTLGAAAKDFCGRCTDVRGL